MFVEQFEFVLLGAVLHRTAEVAALPALAEDRSARGGVFFALDGGHVAWVLLDDESIDFAGFLRLLVRHVMLRELVGDLGVLGVTGADGLQTDDGEVGVAGADAEFIELEVGLHVEGVLLEDVLFQVEHRFQGLLLAAAFEGNAKSAAEQAFLGGLGGLTFRAAHEEAGLQEQRLGFDHGQREADHILPVALLAGQQGFLPQVLQLRVKIGFVHGDAMEDVGSMGGELVWQESPAVKISAL